MEEEGGRSPAAATQGFESGDSFTLRVRPTDDAYLYLFVSDAHGGLTLVAPDLTEDGSPPAVPGGADARLPAESSLRLDEEPGVERLYLLASTARLNEVEELLEDDRPRVNEAWLIDLRDHYGAERNLDSTDPERGGPPPLSAARQGGCRRVRDGGHAALRSEVNRGYRTERMGTMRRRRVWTAGCISAVLAAAVAVGGPDPAAGQSTGAKGIYEDNGQVGVKFDVLLERNGRLRRVSSTYPFRSGDRFKFEVQTNRSAFVYILNRTLQGDPQSLRSKGIDEIRDDDRRDRSGSRRAYTLLYPRRGGRPAAVRPGAPVQLPPGDRNYFVMDDNPGVEKVYVLASEQRIDVSEYFDIENGRQRTGPPRRGNPPGGGGGSIEDDVLDQLNARLASWVGNADVAFAEEDADSKGIDVAGYGVVRDDEQPGTVEVTLRHLPRR